MRRSYLRLVSAVVFGFPLVSGCSHVCCRPSAPPPAAMPGFAPAPGPAVPGFVAPAQPPPAPPPAAPDVRLYPPEWRAVPDPGRLTPEPAPANPEPGRPGVRLLPPETGPARTEAPRAPAGAAPLPVGIPDFAMARERVAAGLKPHLDGLDWLKANGYRAVLHLRAPGQDDTADRREWERRGLTYRSLEIEPRTLSRSLLDEFNRTVADASLQPLFVYDRDGKLAGALWYLHFRTTDKAGDELARSKASRLGLREDADPEQRTLWVAIQKLLGDLGQ